MLMPFSFDRPVWTSSTLMMVLALPGTLCVGQEQRPVAEAVPSVGNQLLFDDGLQQVENDRPQPSEEQQRLIKQIEAVGGQYDVDESAEKWELQSVYLQDAALTNELLDLLSRQHSLQQLSFYQTPLTDDGVKRLGTLKNLQYLNLHSTLVTDEGLKSLGSLVSLNRLTLGSCEVTGEGLVAVTHLPLERLYVGSTSVNDDGLAVIGRIAALKDLSMWGVPITDKGIAHLRRLSKLESLNMRATIITDAALEHLAKLRNLQDLDILGTLVTGSGLAHLRDLPNLTSIDISRTALRDKSLKSIFPLQHLTRIDLEKTKATQAGVRELWRVMPRLEVQGIETLRPGDEETARQLLREQGDLAIAEYDRRLLEESSPRKREVLQTLRLRDDRVRSYRFEWEQTTVSDKGTTNADDDVEIPLKYSLTVDDRRFASAMQGSEVTQNTRTSGNATFSLGRLFTTRQSVAAQRVKRQSRFDGGFDQELLEYPDSKIPATGIRRLAGRASGTRTEMWPLLWTYSTFDRSIVNLDWRRIEVADEQESIEGRPCIQLRQVDAQQNVFTFQNGITTQVDLTTRQTWSIDPSRGHSIVRYTTGYGEQEPNLVMDIQHRQTEDDGWVPTGWTIRQQNGTASDITTATVTKMELNVDTTDDEFALEFPPGIGVE